MWAKTKIIITCTYYLLFYLSGARHLWIGFVVVLLRAYPPGSQVVSDHVGQREKIVPGRGHVPVLDEREVQVPVKGLFHRDHVLQTGDGRHADLLPELFHVRYGHDDGRAAYARIIKYIGRR